MTNSLTKVDLFFLIWRVYQSVIYFCNFKVTLFIACFRHRRLISGFCSSGSDFAVHSSRLHLAVQTLGVALGFVGNYASCGLTPQTDGMPIILKKGTCGCSQVPCTFIRYLRSVGKRLLIYCIFHPVIGVVCAH